MHYEKFADGSVKCIEDEIPFELPDGWAWARISSICVINPKNDLNDDTEVSFIVFPKLRTPIALLGHISPKSKLNSANATFDNSCCSEYSALLHESDRL